MNAFLSQRLITLQQTLPPQVRLIAVTKQVPAEIMRQAYAAGIRDFGENRLQEALAKQAQLQDLPDLTWHFIGHLQSNKIKPACQHFDWIHTVDSLKLAQKLNQQAIAQGYCPKLCLQVKPRPDPNKYGWEFDALKKDWPALEQCNHLNLQGLMTILPLGLSEPEALAAFIDVKALSESLSGGFKLSELSMGMSADYALAIRAGATMVRLGRFLFGERPQ